MEENKMTNSARIIQKKKLRRKRRRSIQRLILLGGLMAIIVTALRTASDFMLIDKTMRHEDSRIQAASALPVKQPAERHGQQIQKDLEKYAGKSSFAAEIYDNRNQYPEALLSAYLNNPEMEEFTAGYLTSGAPQSSPQGGLSDTEIQQDFPLLLQWDKRWGYVSYGGSIIGLSGCGPTCLSMVLVSLTGQTDQTPAQVAAFSEANGYYVEGSGTAWALMTEGASRLGLSARELSLDESVMKSALDSGQPVICSMGAGDFTTQGHFILIYGYNEEGFLINDPNCIARSSQPWTFERLRGQIKNLWAYRPAV